MYQKLKLLTPSKISEKLKAIFNSKDGSIFTLEISSNILQTIYPKLTVNCVCNPLTVILNQNLGLIRAQYEPLIRMICREVHDVAVSQRIHLPSKAELEEIVLETMVKFSDHYSSTYLDHQAGKTTEIDYINGRILEIADKNKVDVPITRLLVKVMKEIEVKRRRCASSGEFYQQHAAYLEGVKTQLLTLARS